MNENGVPEEVVEDLENVIEQEVVLEDTPVEVKEEVHENVLTLQKLAELQNQLQTETESEQPKKRRGRPAKAAHLDL